MTGCVCVLSAGCRRGVSCVDGGLRGHLHLAKSQPGSSSVVRLRVVHSGTDLIQTFERLERPCRCGSAASLVYIASGQLPPDRSRFLGIPTSTVRSVRSHVAVDQEME